MLNLRYKNVLLSEHHFHDPLLMESFHCSLELCYLWLFVVNGQLVLGLQVHSRKTEVAAREVTAGLLIHAECQQYLLASSCLCCSPPKCVRAFAAIWILSESSVRASAAAAAAAVLAFHETPWTQHTSCVTIVIECACPSWETQKSILFLTTDVHVHFPCESATSQLQPWLKSGASWFFLLGPSGSHWKLN